MPDYEVRLHFSTYARVRINDAEDKEEAIIAARKRAEGPSFISTHNVGLLDNREPWPEADTAEEVEK